jgi:hypothetical protein
MAEAKYFNNTIIGQYVLTKVPVKVYANGRFLIITDVDDVEDPNMGFGMDENGGMRHFDYTAVEFLSVQGNKVDIETYNKGMADAFGAGGDEGGDKKEEEPKEDDKESDKLPKESIDMNLKNILKEISAEEVDAEIEGAEAQIDAAKAKFKAAQAAMKDTMKKSKDKIKAAKANLKVAEEGVVKEDHMGYTFGTGDIIQNKNPKCKHFGSKGIIDKVMELPGYVGKVAIYTVTNNGDTYSPGDKLTKTVDQLEKI